MLNGENWGTFIPAHSERHLKQMKELALLQMLKHSEHKLLSFLEGISEKEFFNKTSETVWSAAELVEHIVLVETGVRKKLHHLTTLEKQEVHSNLPSEQVHELIKDPSRKVKAPDPFIPKGIFKDKTSAVDALKKSRMELEDFVQNVKVPLHEIGFPHFVVGMMNGENWLAFMAGHCERHIAQMKTRIA